MRGLKTLGSLVLLATAAFVLAVRAPGESTGPVPTPTPPKPVPTRSPEGVEREPSPSPSPLNPQNDPRGDEAGNAPGSVRPRQTGKRDFREIVDARLKKEYGRPLAAICSVDTDPTAARIFAEYGAIFLARGVAMPSRCIFESEAGVSAFQSAASPVTAAIGGVSVTLQKAAMEALTDAREEARERGLSITPRGGSEAARRTYADTVRLWNTRFYPALGYHTRRGRITPAASEAARSAPVARQVAMVLGWERSGLFFSKDLSKSILYSVAAPGASQHNFMLAFDVEQFANPAVRAILARHGWFQTVKSDLPHFTYLGRDESELPALGLKQVTIGGQKFWIPDIDDRGDRK